MVPKGQLIEEEEWDTRRFHRLYQHAVDRGVREFHFRVPKELFNLDFDISLPIGFDEMWRLLRRQDLDQSVVTLYAA